MLRRVKNNNQTTIASHIRDRVNVFRVETIAELLNTRGDLVENASLMRGPLKNRTDAYLVELHAFLATGSARHVSTRRIKTFVRVKKLLTRLQSGRATRRGGERRRQG